MATFAYGRVSTSLQDTDNQRLELTNAGWSIDYWFTDTISGKSASNQRPAFKRAADEDSGWRNLAGRQAGSTWAGCH